MQYLNFKDIEYIWHGSWPDPELVYRGKHLNYWDVEEFLPAGTYTVYVFAGGVMIGEKSFSLD